MPTQTTRLTITLGVFTGVLLTVMTAQGNFSRTRAQVEGGFEQSNAVSDNASSSDAASSTETSSAESSEAISSAATSSAEAESASASSEAASSETVSSIASSVASSVVSSEAASVESTSSASSVSSESASSAAAVNAIRGTIITAANTGMLGNSWIQFSIARNSQIASADDLQSQLRVTLTGADGEIIQPNIGVTDRGDAYVATVLPPASFRPGTYTLHVEARPGAFGRLFEGLFGQGEGNAIVEGTVEWGTVAVNTDQGAYAQGEDVIVTQASLDASGTLRCADTFSAGFAGAQSKTLNTACGNGSVTLRMPSSEATLTATLVAGSKTDAVSRVVAIRNAQDIGVRRTAPTAVSGGSDGTMTIAVTFPQGLRGVVREMVPAGFAVSNVQPLGEVQNLGEDGTQITWDGQWEAGTRTFTYAYRAPETEPTMGLFGPLTVRADFTGVAEPVVAPASSSAESSAAASSTASEAASSSDASSEAAVDAESASSEGIVTPEESTSVTEGEPLSFWDGFSNALASLFRPQSLTASVTIDGQTLSFEEDTRWQMLVAQGPTSADSRDRTLELTRTAVVFAADAAPSFTLVKTDLSAEENITDADEHLKTDIAYREVLHAVISDEDIQAAALEQVILEHADVIAERAAPALTDRASGTSVRGVAFEVENVLTESSDARQTLVEALTDTENVQDAAEALAGPGVTEAVVSRLTEIISDAPETAVSAETVQTIVAESTDAHDAEKDAAALAVATAAGSNRDATEAVRTAVTETAPQETETSAPLLTLHLTGPDGKLVENPPFHFAEGSVEIALDPLPAFRPGLYTLTVTVTNPLTGEQEVFTQQFVWGVLAVNADKDIYDVNETAFLSFGVLDDKGEIVCDADLTLQITRPDGTVQVLNSEDQTVLTTGTCGRKEAGFIQPDYVAVLPLQQTGDYTLRLTADFAGKERSIATELHVQPDAPFSITRKSATRLWPFAPSPMVITVRFNTDVAGTITDTVPPGFIISDILPFGITYQDPDGTTHVRWEGAWNAGESISFRYFYDAPDISPYFYLIGPLQIGSDEPFTGSTLTNTSSAQ